MRETCSKRDKAPAQSPATSMLSAVRNRLRPRSNSDADCANAIPVVAIAIDSATTASRSARLGKKPKEISSDVEHTITGQGATLQKGPGTELAAKSHSLAPLTAFRLGN